ncbi:MAG: biopolymer transporter ExbD, partial [Oligoflexia bacterium]|nr:biopolymer transporter ExbD [Oligoflexia bacterium]
SKRKRIKDTEPVAVIQADNKTPHGVVVNVLDIVKQCGITKIAIATEKKKAE